MRSQQARLLFLFLTFGCGLQPVTGGKDSVGDSQPTGPVSAGALSVSTQLLDFGELDLGDWAELDLVVSANSEEGFGLDITLEGDAFDISESRVNVAVGVDSVLIASFEPDRPGEFQGSVTLDAETGDSLLVELRGSGAGDTTDTTDTTDPTDDTGTPGDDTGDPPGPDPDIEPTPSSVNFGSVSVGATSTYTVLIANEGDSDLDISAVSATGDFVVTGGTLSVPATLAPGANKTVDVLFRPSTSGSATGSLLVTSNDPDEPTLSVSLSGTGDTSCTTCDPVIRVSPTTISDFFVFVGFLNDSRTVTIYNDGDEDLTISDVDINNDFLFSDGEFSVSGISPPTVISPGGRETFEIVFEATDSGVELDQAIIDLNTCHIRSDDPSNRDVVINLAGAAL